MYKVNFTRLYSIQIKFILGGSFVKKYYIVLLGILIITGGFLFISKNSSTDKNILVSNTTDLNIDSSPLQVNTDPAIDSNEYLDAYDGLCPDVNLEGIVSTISNKPERDFVVSNYNEYSLGYFFENNYEEALNRVLEKESIESIKKESEYITNLKNDIYGDSQKEKEFLDEISQNIQSYINYTKLNKGDLTIELSSELKELNSKEKMEQSTKMNNLSIKDIQFGNQPDKYNIDALPFCFRYDYTMYLDNSESDEYLIVNDFYININDEYLNGNVDAPKYILEGMIETGYEELVSNEYYNSKEKE